MFLTVSEQAHTTAVQSPRVLYFAFHDDADATTYDGIPLWLTSTARSLASPGTAAPSRYHQLSLILYYVPDVLDQVAIPTFDNDVRCFLCLATHAGLLVGIDEAHGLLDIDQADQHFLLLKLAITAQANLSEDEIGQRLTQLWAMYTQERGRCVHCLGMGWQIHCADLRSAQWH